MQSNTFRRILPLAGAVLAAAAVARAADDVPGAVPSSFTEHVAVSANFVPGELETIGSSVTVLDAGEIAARDELTVLDLLRTVPGVAVVQNGGPGRAGSVFLRGANSSHTLVLVDGVRVNNPETGAFDFADLVPQQLERIEVLRGPQSSMYGSEAIGGVINIVTRRGAPGHRGEAEASLGASGTEIVSGAADGGAGALDYALAASHQRLPGFSLAAERAGDTRLNPYRNLSLSGRAGARFAGAGRVDVALRYVAATTHPDGYAFGIGPVPAPLFEQDRRALAGNASVSVPVTTWWRQVISAGLNRERLDGTDPDPAMPYNNFRIRTAVVNAGVRNELTLAPADVLTIGYSYERRHGEDAGNFDETVGIHSVYAQNQWSRAERVYLTASVRNDRHGVFGAATTYRATGVVRFPSRGVRVHASWGTGFKAPTFTDLYYPYYGNPGLRPETSRGFDAGVEKQIGAGRVVADATFFRNDFRDLIDFDLATYRAANVARARSRGVEATLGVKASDRLHLDVSYTYTRAEDALTGRPLPRRPAHQAAATALWRASRAVSGSVSVVVVRSRVDADGTKLDNYVRVDGALRWRLAGSLDATVRVLNLFDRQYAEVPGYLTPGRLASAGLAVSF